MRDYGTATWEGGDPECKHESRKQVSIIDTGKGKLRDKPFNICKCGAVRIDSQLGLERTPEEYLAKMVAVFREARRVLRKDGTLWLNMGDSYAGSWGNNGSRAGGQRVKNETRFDRPGYDNHTERPPASYGLPGLKPKDLCGIPWRLALALQADGWWLRSDIIWAKPNPMPESVTDRPTKAHEYIFLLTKSAKYFYDAEAIKEPAIKGAANSNFNTGKTAIHQFNRSQAGDRKDNIESGRNARSVWTIATQPFPEAHFATFPEELVRRCMLAGTSERGACPDCGKPWVRVNGLSDEYAKMIKTFRVTTFDGVEIGKYIQAGLDEKGLNQSQLAEYFPSNTGGKTGCVHNWVTGKNIPTAKQYKTIKDILSLGDRFDLLLENPATGENIGWELDNVGHGVKRQKSDHPSQVPSKSITLGFRPQCECGKEPVGCVVHDPFCGAGTTPVVALKGNRRFVGFELKQEYIDMANKRLGPLLAQGVMI